MTLPDELKCRTCKEKITINPGMYVVITHEEFVSQIQCIACFEEEWIGK